MAKSSPFEPSSETRRRPGKAPGPRASAMPPAVNSLDHSIYRQNGTTSALDCTRRRLQSTKFQPAPNLLTRVEDLTRELGHLRHEVRFYRKCFELLQRLRETSYDVYQQLFLASYFPPDPEHLQKLTMKLHRELENSVRQEVKAEKDWKAFLGIQYDEKESKGGLI